MAKSDDFLFIGAIVIMAVGTFVFFKDQILGIGGGGQASCYGANGNCTWDVCDSNHQSFCWESRSSSDNFFKTCSTTKPGAKPLTVSQGCLYARAYFCSLHSADGKCTSNKCPSGKALNYQGVCV